MNRLHYIALSALVALTTASCGSDDDEPKPSLIDTTGVDISATVSVDPSAAWAWYTTADQLTVNVSDVDMHAPKGVLLKSVNLLANGTPIAEKPFSGDPLAFKVPLNSVGSGRLNLSVVGTLAEKNSLDAQIIIADNLEQTVFNVMPDFECVGRISISIKARSTSGELLDRTFQVSSTSHFRIDIPQSQLYWTPLEGTAATLDVTMTASADVFSTNSTLAAKATQINWGYDHSSTPELHLTLPNVPGSLAAQDLSILVNTVRYGVWEGINTGETKLMYYFKLQEI